MLRLELPAVEGWNSIKEEFFTFPSKVISLEHSLVSVSKWESKWKKAFISNKAKTTEETVDYIRCMLIDGEFDESDCYRLLPKHIDAVNEYISDPMTATYFREESENKKNGYPLRETITSELIYYWMIQFGIPFECETWHLNRLLSLIKVCKIKSMPPKKMSRQEIMRRNAELNAKRKKQLKTNG